MNGPQRDERVKRIYWTIPNVLTVARILLTPAIVFAFIDHHLERVWVIFGLAGVTDALDGFLARILNQRSDFGAMLDPLADKILLDTTYICLGLKGWLPLWLVLLVVGRDCSILVGLALLAFRGVDVRQKIHPTIVSKCNTAAQVFLVITVLGARTFGWNLFYTEMVLTLATGVLTCISGTHYFLKGISFIPKSHTRI